MCRKTIVTIFQNPSFNMLNKQEESVSTNYSPLAWPLNLWFISIETCICRGSIKSQLLILILSFSKWMHYWIPLPVLFFKYSIHYCTLAVQYASLGTNIKVFSSHACGFDFSCKKNCSNTVFLNWPLVWEKMPLLTTLRHWSGKVYLTQNRQNKQIYSLSKWKWKDQIYKSNWSQFWTQLFEWYW